MTSCVADTHALVWYLFARPELSKRARGLFDEAASSGGRIFVPTISIVEIIYLTEKNRLPGNILTRLKTEIELPDSVIFTIDLSCAIALEISLIPRQTLPDMPDRIIAATALHLGLPLVTRDVNIAKLINVETVW